MTPRIGKILGRVCVASAILTAVAPREASAQAGPVNAGLRAIVGLNARVMRQDAMEEHGAVVTNALSAGESTHLGVSVGRGDELCRSSLWSSTSDDFPARMA